MKKIMTLILAAALCLTALVGCGDNAGTDSNNNDSKTYKVAVVQQLDHSSLNEIRDAIEAELDAAPEGVTVTYENFNGQNDSTVLNQIGSQIVSGGYDAIIPIGTLAAKIGRKRTIQCGIVLLATCFMLGYLLTTMYTSIQPIMYVVFALVGLAWAAINVNSLPMVVEMCRGSDIGKFTGYYYTFSMAAQVVTPIVAGSLMRAIDYRVLFPYAALFVALSFVTMCFVRHGDTKAEAKKGLDAFEDMDT